ncbi:MAG TPA: 4a-hydroxytetrahydrobiopterin dehydratase [Actinomycetes bacterium]
MPELLDQASIDTALASLPGWSYDDNKLVKRVPVPSDSHDQLEKAVAEVADEMNHHPEVERGPDELRFQLWTHSAGGVTQKDVELAARIDQTLSGPAQQ